MEDYDEFSKNPSAEGGKGKAGRHEDNDDEEEMPRGQRVQCSQQ